MPQGGPVLLHLDESGMDLDGSGSDLDGSELARAGPHKT